MSILNVVASDLGSLTATNPICVELGDTLTANTNLFMYTETSNDVDAVTILPYGGEPPNIDNYRQSVNFQIRMKSRSSHTLMETQQRIIEYMNMNQLSGNGQVRSLNSAPIQIGVLEGGEYKIAVSNYEVKYLKQ